MQTTSVAVDLQLPEQRRQAICRCPPWKDRFFSSLSLHCSDSATPLPRQPFESKQESLPIVQLKLGSQKRPIIVRYAKL